MPKENISTLKIKLHSKKTISPSISKNSGVSCLVIDWNSSSKIDFVFVKRNSTSFSIKLSPNSFVMSKSLRDGSLPGQKLLTGGFKISHD